MSYLREYAKLSGRRRFAEDLAEAPPADLEFVQLFATKMYAKGSRPLSLDQWEETMRRALGLNIGEDAATRYNKFDLGAVSKALRQFSSISVTPAREVGPALYASGPLDSLAEVMKRATALKATTAELDANGTLHLSWD